MTGSGMGVAMKMREAVIRSRAWVVITGMRGVITKLKMWVVVIGLRMWVVAMGSRMWVVVCAQITLVNICEIMDNYVQ